MVCHLTYVERTAEELVRTPFLYPAAADLAAPRLIVEVGPGRGDFLFHLAETNPGASVVGIEKKRKRVDKLVARTEKRGLKNVAIIQDDARDAIPRFFAEGTVDEIHVQFPDPWPKRRHGKNRSLSLEFLESCRRALKPGGTIAILTDSEPYSEAVAENAAGVTNLEAVVVTEGDFDAIYPTFFSEKWKADNRRLFVRKYRRTI